MMELKFCTKCEQHKPLDEFGKDKYKKSGKRNYCKACESKRVVAYNQEHRDERNAYYSRRWFADVEESRKHHMECIKRNPNTPITASKAKNRYFAKYPQFMALRSLWQYRKKTNHPLIVALYQSQNGICRYCDASLEAYYEIDHIMPLVRGGSNEVENIALCCEVCNASKGKKTLEEWRKDI